MYLISKTEDLWAKRFLTLQVQSPSVLKIDGLWTLWTRAPHPPSSCIHLAEPRYADQASNTVTEDGLPFNTSLEIVIGPRVQSVLLPTQLVFAPDISASNKVTSKQKDLPAKQVLSRHPPDFHSLENRPTSSRCTPSLLPQHVGFRFITRGI